MAQLLFPRKDFCFIYSPLTGSSLKKKKKKKGRRRHKATIWAETALDLFPSSLTLPLAPPPVSLRNLKAPRPAWLK